MTQSCSVYVRFLRLVTLAVICAGGGMGALGMPTRIVVAELCIADVESETRSEL
jgi:hypothetical protein